MSFTAESDWTDLSASDPIHCPDTGNRKTFSFLSSRHAQDPVVNFTFRIPSGWHGLSLTGMPQIPAELTLGCCGNYLVANIRKLSSK